MNIHAKYYTKVNLFFGNLMLGETLVEDQRFSEAVSKDAEETNAEGVYALRVCGNASDKYLLCQDLFYHPDANRGTDQPDHFRNQKACR